MIKSFVLSLGLALAATAFAEPAAPAGPPSGPAPALAVPPQAVGDRVGPINIPGGNIDSFLSLVEKYTGRTLLRPQNLPDATLTLDLKESITKQEAVQAIETLLNLNGYAITPLGERFLKITPINLAKSEAPEFIETSTLGLTPSGRIASRLFQLQFLRIGEFMPQIAGLLNPAAASPPVVFEKANAALITDSITNLQRIETLVQRLDQPTLAGMVPKFYTLHFAKASDVVNKLRTVLSGALQNQIGTATSYNADDRTNQIVLVTDSRQHAFFDELIAKLDVKSDPNTRNEVIFLKHATAKDVATILTQLVTGQNNAAKSTGQDTGRTTTAPTNTSAVVTSTGPNGMPPTQTTATPSTVSTPSASTLGLAQESSSQFSAILTILSEERSNAIVASGTVDDIRLIKDLVAKIDVLLAQVRIEVVVAEVTLEDADTSGISALGLNLIGNKLVGYSGTTAGGDTISKAVTSVSTVGSSDTSNVLLSTVSLTTTPRKTDTNILSATSITTTHNKEGKIFVGEERPVISSYLSDSSTTTSSSSGYRSTVSYKDIGITLTVKPLIGLDGSVQLEIKEEVKDVLGEVTIDGNSQPRIGSRTAEAFVSATSGDIIVTGGLQRVSKTRSTNRLGPIPIIGDLLGSRTSEKSRTDLVFFLRPYVLTNTAQDNAAAFSQIEALPAKEREGIEKAIKPAKKP